MKKENQFIKIMGCSKEQYDAQKKVCREQLRQMLCKAELKGKYRGFTASQLRDILRSY